MFDGVGLNSQADPEPVKTEVQVTDDYDHFRHRNIAFATKRRTLSNRNVARLIFTFSQPHNLKRPCVNLEH